MKSHALLLAAALCLGGPAALAAQPAADAQALADCIDVKAGPEGDLPQAGPLRDQMLAQMEGGPQACIGIVARACTQGGRPPNECIGRESRAWLAAIAAAPETGAPARNRAIWRKAAGEVRAQAIRLCEGAAALAAWGRDRVAAKGSYGFTPDHDCVRDAIAQQALILLVNVRGN